MIYKGAAAQSIVCNSAVYNMDCMEALRQTPNKYYDLAIVDPPYGLGDKLLIGGAKGGMGSVRKSFKSLEDKKWDNIPEKQYWDELFRVSKNQIIWGGNYFLDNLKSTRCFIVWDKMNGTNSLADAELAWTSFDKNVRIFKMHHFSDGYDAKIHPTQKPTKLYKWILETYATCKKCHNEGGMYEDVAGDGGSRMYIDCEYCDVATDGVPKILDTHIGSGSSRIAAYDMGFDFTGFELDADYFASQEKRFAEHVVNNGNKMFKNEPNIVTQPKLL